MSAILDGCGFGVQKTESRAFQGFHRVLRVSKIQIFDEFFMVHKLCTLSQGFFTWDYWDHSNFYLKTWVTILRMQTFKNFSNQT